MGHLETDDDKYLDEKKSLVLLSVLLEEGFPEANRRWNCLFTERRGVAVTQAAID